MILVIWTGNLVGSRFGRGFMSLCLPLLHISPPPPPPPPMTMVAEPPQFHVLAVDDSITDRKLIEKLLKTSSFHVTTVDSGSKALEFLGLMEDHPPSVPSFHQEVEVNLVITDYCMPGMSGYDLLKKIKESSSLKDIPVVIMSSENAPSRINRCLEEGAKEFLLKPVKLSDMKKLRPHILRGQCKEEEEAGDPQDLQKKRKRKAMVAAAASDDDEEEGFAPERKTRRRRRKTLTSCSQRPMQRGGGGGSRRSTRPATEEEKEEEEESHGCCC